MLSSAEIRNGGVAVEEHFLVLLSDMKEKTVIDVKENTGHVNR